MVAFALGRKRDKRVVAYKKKLEEKAEENKQKTREFQKKQREERKKLLETAPDGGFHMNSMEEQLRQLEGAWEKNCIRTKCSKVPNF
jgi:DnaJ family protein A protein 5